MKFAKLALAGLGSFGTLMLALIATGPSRIVPSASASVLPVAPIASAAAGQQGFGTIKGRLVWGGPDAPKSEEIKPNKDTNVCGKTAIFNREMVVDPSTKGIAHAFAYVATPKAKNAEAETALLSAHPKVEIDQKSCEFLPYSLAMHQKQEIIFKSSDPIGHNARYSGFTNGTKNVALPPNGSISGKLKAERRPMTLNCDIHPWMKGWIMVFDHPFFAVTAADGSFEIQGVPAGSQNLVIWQEKVGYVTPGASKGQAVTVKAGETTDVGEIRLDPKKVKK